MRVSRQICLRDVAPAVISVRNVMYPDVNEGFLRTFPLNPARHPIDTRYASCTLSRLIHNCKAHYS